MRTSDEVRIGFLGHGAYVPETVLTNQDLERLVDTSDEWIQRRTGVRARRVLDGRETILDMAVKASRRALAESGVEPTDIVEVRVATCTWLKLPSLSAHLQRVLGLPRASACDVNAGCAGFIYAVEDAWNKLVLDRLRHGRRSCVEMPNRSARRSSSASFSRRYGSPVRISRSSRMSSSPFSSISWTLSASS